MHRFFYTGVYCLYMGYSMKYLCDLYNFTCINSYYNAHQNYCVNLQVTLLYRNVSFAVCHVIDCK